MPVDGNVARPGSRNQRRCHACTRRNGLIWASQQVSISFYSPLPPAPSGVADYAAALLKALEPRVRTHVNDPGGRLSIRQVGNNLLHSEIYRQALEQPGIVVLHDGTLQHLLMGILPEQAYIDECIYNYGDAEKARKLWENRAQSPSDPAYFEYGLLRRIAERSRLVLVHGAGLERRVLAHAPNANVARIPHLALPVATDPYARHAFRASIGAGPATMVVGLMGHLRESKRIFAVLRAFQRILPADAVLLLGGTPVHEGLSAALTPLLGPQVHAMEFANEAEFLTAVAAQDISINLRYPSSLETSGMVIRSLGSGVPCIISDEPSDVGLPDACIRVPHGPGEEDHLVEVLRWALEHPTRRKELGELGRVAIERDHAPAIVVDLLLRYTTET